MQFIARFLGETHDCARDLYNETERCVIDRTDIVQQRRNKSISSFFMVHTVLLGSNAADFHSWLPSQESLSTHQGIRVHCNFLQNSQNNLLSLYATLWGFCCVQI